MLTVNGEWLPADWRVLAEPGALKVIAADGREMTFAEAVAYRDMLVTSSKPALKAGWRGTYRQARA